MHRGLPLHKLQTWMQKKPPLTYLAAHGEVAPVVGVNTHKVSLPAFLNQIGLFTFLLDAHYLLWTLQPADT